MSDQHPHFVSAPVRDRGVLAVGYPAARQMHALWLSGRPHGVGLGPLAVKSRRACPRWAAAFSWRPSAVGTVRPFGRHGRGLREAEPANPGGDAILSEYSAPPMHLVLVRCRHGHRPLDIPWAGGGIPPCLTSGKAYSRQIEGVPDDTSMKSVTVSAQSATPAANHCF